jgi:hypothetical protein
VIRRHLHRRERTAQTSPRLRWALTYD